MNGAMMAIDYCEFEARIQVGVRKLFHAAAHELM